MFSIRNVGVRCLSTARKTTGIAGLPPHPKPKDALSEIYGETLKILADFPAESTYRQSTEALIKSRLTQLERQTNESLLKPINSSINEDPFGRIGGMGAMPIERVLVVAQDELNLAKKMLEWRAWEPLEEKPRPDQWTYFK